jgi:ATP adenylyltransferase/5',5'''-P-1,P-4-tetraphosphate phosphorylase II
VFPLISIELPSAVAISFPFVAFTQSFLEAMFIFPPFSLILCELMPLIAFVMFISPLLTVSVESESMGLLGIR